MSEDSKKMQEFIETAKTITENLNAVRDYNNCVVSERAEQVQLRGAAALGALEGGAVGAAVTIPVRLIPVVGNPVANVFTATAAIVQADNAVKVAREDIAAHNMACAEAAANEEARRRQEPPASVVATASTLPAPQTTPPLARAPQPAASIVRPTVERAPVLGVAPPLETGLPTFHVAHSDVPLAIAAPARATASAADDFMQNRQVGLTNGLPESNRRILSSDAFAADAARRLARLMPPHLRQLRRRGEGEDAPPASVVDTASTVPAPQRTPVFSTPPPAAPISRTPLSSARSPALSVAPRLETGLPTFHAAHSGTPLATAVPARATASAADAFMQNRQVGLTNGVPESNSRILSSDAFAADATRRLASIMPAPPGRQLVRRGGDAPPESVVATASTAPAPRPTPVFMRPRPPAPKPRPAASTPRPTVVAQISNRNYYVGFRVPIGPGVGGSGRRW